ncbi:hypothetical protein BGZ96_000744 [Linnemannia gamsii]|uniref:Uncharacterized protein n=1 Tax=Linnemannia gamsii TaxID=64522 RepID=A0ABQ7JNH0_9FUNG|nr:hypothetical protein BGZ96_000744 [Linnemannia gamsii]
MPTLGPGIFSWALQEKKDMDGYNNHEPSPLLRKQDGERLLLLRHGLVPLEDVEVVESETVPLTDELHNVVFAFSWTLTRIIIYRPSDRRRHPEIVPHPGSLFQFPAGVVHLGQRNTGQTDLLVLKTLHVHLSADARLVLGPDFLARYPKVESVALIDTTFDYEPQEVIQQRCFPARLRRVKALVLQGWPALTFYPDTLYSTRRLVDLRMSTTVRSDEHCYIASSLEDNCEDENHQYGQFALLFDFRMLEKCPLLGIVTLNIYTNTGHSRILTRDELFERPTLTTLNMEDNYSEGEDQLVKEVISKRIVARELHILTLIGGWSISEESGLSLQEVLNYFEAHHWTTGITTVEDVLETVRSIPLTNLKIRTMSLRLDLSRDEDMKRVEELGMVPAGDDVYDTGGKDVGDGKRSALLPMEVYYRFTKYRILKLLKQAPLSSAVS